MFPKGMAKAVSLKPLQQKEFCGLMFEGLLQINKEGLYTFNLNSDDGSQLFINEKMIIDNNGMRDIAMEKSENVHLAEGHYAIRIMYYQHKGPSTLEVFYQGPGVKKQAIPSTSFFHKAER